MAAVTLFEETDRKFQETSRELRESNRELNKIIKELGKRIDLLGDRFCYLTEGMAMPSMEAGMGHIYVELRLVNLLNQHVLVVDPRNQVVTVNPNCPVAFAK